MLSPWLAAPSLLSCLHHATSSRSADLDACSDLERGTSTKMKRIQLLSAVRVAGEYAASCARRSDQVWPFWAKRRARLRVKQSDFMPGQFLKSCSENKLIRTQSETHALIAMENFPKALHDSCLSVMKPSERQGFAE